MPSRSVLAINSGSSSVKFGLFDLAPDPPPLVRGVVDASNGGAPVAERLLARLSTELDARPLAGIGHRIVHGGPRYHEPVLVTDRLLDDLKELVPFAPNHLPNAVAIVEECRQAIPDTPQVLCFDTAFHADLPEIARRLPIPREYDDQGLRRYGFHGLSYAFLLEELRRQGGATVADGRLVLAHLGNGSSLAAVSLGRPVDTSMAFTPLAGVVMSTRSGDLDPGLVTYLARTTGLDPERLEHVFSHRSGLAGISGRSGDMRDLLAHEHRDENCRLAVAIYCYEIRKRIGAYAAALEGVDALVFSGGIGERSPIVRARICSGLEFLGVRLDPARNAANAPVISHEPAGVAVHVIRADEEIVIARAVHRLLH